MSLGGNATAADSFLNVVKRGLSFSGRERHCIFLNKMDGSFADVSTISGLDLPDDGRGSARCDWDHDGDIDLWVSNRNAPTVRYFENQVPPSESGGFVAFRLEGSECNRDAIGARLRLELTGESQPLIRTLRAGEGFLSQSSKWVHFGIGRGREIERLSISWPGGETEELAGLQVNTRYRIVQGTKTAAEWSRAEIPPLADAALALPEPQGRAAITSLSRIGVPPLHYTDIGGKAHTLFGNQTANRPTLINLWATWCSPCLQELSELTRRSAELETAGLDVVALCVDSVNDQNSGTVQSPGEIAKKLGLPFTVGIANTQLVDTLQMVHNLMFDIHVPLPLPSSFLIDGNGQLLVLYKGPLSVDDLLADATTRAATQGVERRGLTEPFPGKWIAEPRVLSFFDLAISLFERGYTDDAIFYYKKHGKALSNHPQTPGIMVALGKALETKGAYQDAMGAYQFGLTKSADYVPALVALATLRTSCPDARLRDLAQAAQLAEQAVRATGARDSEALQALAAAFEANGRNADANAVRAVMKELEKEPK